MPTYRPGVGLKKRTLPYTRLRRRSRPRSNKQELSGKTVNTEIVLFDHGPAEFPVATAMPREPRGQAIALVAAFQKWLLERWTWLRPRTIPCVVAALGMVAVIASARYLANQEPEVSAARIVHVSISP
jgi:hypothetical protein